MEFTEILTIALSAIRANKLRSILTLLGIVIGVMTAVQVLQNGIESGLSALGAHTFQIQKFPIMASRQEWLKARNRKDITVRQCEYVQERMTTAMLIGIEAADGGKVIQAPTGEKTNPNVTIMGETPDGV